MSEADFQPLVAWLQAHPNWVFISVLLISFIESLALAGVIVPGVLLLFLVSAVAGHLDLPLSLILLAGFLGAILGDGISFFLGHYYKDSLRRIWPFSRYPKTLKLGEDFFAKHGGKSVVLGRFIGPVRPVIPIVAGMLGMSQLRFSVFNALSAVAWAPFYILPGYLTGSAIHLELPDNFYSVLISFVSALIVLALLFRYASLKLQKGAALYTSLLPSQPATSQANSPKSDGYPLASLVLFIIAFFAFIIWSVLLTQAQLLQTIDQTVLQLSLSLSDIHPLFSKLSTTFFIHLTLLGDEGFLYISFTILVALMLYLGRYRAGLLLILSGLSTAAITHGLKAAFMIPRPDVVMTAPDSFAYPSGHSSGATVLYGLIAAFIAEQISQHQRWKCYLLFSLPMLGIALSRVMLNVHWLSDIVGGILLGLTICGASRFIYGKYPGKQPDQSIEKSTQIKALSIALIAWLLATAAYQAIFFGEAFLAYQMPT